MARGRNSCFHLALPPRELSKISSKIKTLTSKKPPVIPTWRLCIPSGITELPCGLGANSRGQSVLYAGSCGLKLYPAAQKCSLIRLKSKTILAQLASGTSHLALLCPQQYPVQFGAKPRCPAVPVNADPASIHPPPLGYGAYERAALCLESAFQDPSFGTGSAVVPTSAPVKHRFFKMVRRPTLLHIPVILPPVFLNMSSKFERLSPNCALTKITWRLCVPSGISELPCAFAANSGGQIFLEEGSSGRVQSGFSSAVF